MGNTAKDVKQESADKVEAKETKSAEKKAETKPATSAKPAEKKAEEKKTDKEAEKKPAEKKEEKKTAEKKVEDKPSAEAEKKAGEKPSEEVDNVQQEENIEQIANENSTQYPYDIILKRAIRTFRGPSTELLNKPFGGKLTVLSCIGDFYKVQFIRAGFGSVTAYVLCKEVERCIS